MRVCTKYLSQRIKISEQNGKSFKGVSKRKKKKKRMERLGFITQFKIEFLLPFTSCRKVFGNMATMCQKLKSVLNQNCRIYGLKCITRGQQICKITKFEIPHFLFYCRYLVEISTRSYINHLWVQLNYERCSNQKTQIKMRSQEPGTKPKFKVFIIFPSSCRLSFNEVFCQFLTKSNQPNLKYCRFCVFLAPRSSQISRF